MALPYPSMDFVPFDILTAEELDQMVANIESVADGSGLAAGAVVPSALATGASRANVATSETTTSTTYADLTTTTDSVTVTIGANGLAFVTVKAQARTSVAAGLMRISFAVSGASTVAASDTNGVNQQAINVSYTHQLTNGGMLVTGLTPGSTTFKMKYAVGNGGSGSGTGTFLERSISVIPL